MANFIKIIGTIAICAGIALVAFALMPLREGKELALPAWFLLGEAATVISGGIVALGLGQLIAVNKRMAESMAGLYDFIRDQNAGEEPEPQAAPAREAFANIPNYDPRRDPRVVKESSYRARTVLTLEDGTIAVETSSGWKRFRSIRDFDRLAPA
jgi:hypothetical protein